MVKWNQIKAMTEWSVMFSSTTTRFNLSYNDVAELLRKAYLQGKHDERKSIRK